MNFDKLDSKPNLPKIQEEILSFWEKDNTFKKSVDKTNNKEVVFYDGPPFPTGKPHHGTVLVSFIKDMVARYWTMRGYRVDRQWGWDCHGLPIENQVETNLGITSKKDIECELGIANFNNACKTLVSVNNDTWKTYVNEMARWVDYDGSYKTMDTNFMESVIWAFKAIYNKGLIYKDYRVTPYCFRCQTSLSISDTRESDSTRPKQDTWVLVKFKSQMLVNNKPVYFLAWTTTPWTLPSNMALAVGKNIDYVYVEQENAVYVVGESAVSRYEKVLGKNPNIVKTCKGEELVGKKYEPMFNYFKEKVEEGAFVVIAADYVDANDGVGIVHIAPAFGEDDYWSCKKSNVPLVNPVDAEGLFTSEVTDYAGKNVLEINKEIIRNLKTAEVIIDSGTIEHNYPHCWRCRTPLIYKAMDAWYFNIDQIKSRLLELNEDINWVPEVVKNGRFGNWLENARDWNISRNRYWSTPLPVWECNCGHREVLGSIDEIYKVSGVKVTDLHREHLDKISYKCTSCDGVMTRIPEVIDCWFESAAVPFARLHYPFENKLWFEENATSDFVVEYTGQIRCWFYYLLVLSGALFDKIPFKNAIVHGTVLAKDGKKLSKSSKNYTDPMELMKSYGTDAFRLYMYNSSAILLGDLQFNEDGILDALKDVILPFWNACTFFTTYATIDGYEPSLNVLPNSDDPLDKWMLAKLYDAQTKITENMDKYQVDQYVPHIAPLIDGLTNWYIRRSRRRFWGKGLEKDKVNAYDTLYYVLVNITKLMAPITPIISEKLFKSLTNEHSVHLTKWSTIEEKFKDDELIKENDLVQEIIYLGRAIRTKNSIKTRQPLSKLLVALSDSNKLNILEKFSDVICEELNVKTLEVVNDVQNIAMVKYKPNFSTLGQNNKSKIPQIMAALNANKIKFTKDNAILQLQNETLTLNVEDILVEYHSKDGQNIMHEKGIVAALDLKITDELLKEGVARDIVRQIQEVRKQLGFEITDKVTINLGGNYPKEFLDYITKETLSKFESFDDEKFTCTLESNDGDIIIKIK